MDRAVNPKVEGGWWKVDGALRSPTSVFPLPPSTFHPPPSTSFRSAFTLIELLTAMAILVIIVLIALRIFLQSSTVWNISSTRARINMLGRASVDYVSQKYAATTNPAAVTIGALGVTLPTHTFEPNSTLPLSVEVQTTLTVTDPARARGAVRAWSGGPDTNTATSVDNINSWN